MRGRRGLVSVAARRVSERVERECGLVGDAFLEVIDAALRGRSESLTVSHERELRRGRGAAEGEVVISGAVKGKGGREKEVCG